MRSSVRHRERYARSSFENQGHYFGWCLWPWEKRALRVLEDALSGPVNWPKQAERVG
jgi:hypothetical protein